MNLAKPLAILAFAATSGLACAQGTYASGFLHTPLGATSSMSVVERKLTACCIGSSGEDGVEIHLGSRRGGAVYIDMSPLSAASTVPSTIRVQPTDEAGVVRSTFTVTGTFQDGHVNEVLDLTSGPVLPSGVYVLCYTVNGLEVPLPPFDGPVVTWTTHVAYGPGEQPRWQYGARQTSASDQNFDAMRRLDRAATLDFATSTGSVITVPDVIEVVCRPICIVAPCPGDWTGLGSMRVTGSGMTELSCSDAAFEFKTRCTGCNDPWLGDISAASGNARLTEQCCADLDGDGLQDLVVVAANIGSSGQDGIVTDFPGGVSSASRKWGNGHVTLMKLTDDEGSEMRLSSVKDPVACTTSFTPDFSSQGTVQCVVQCRDQFSNVLSSHLMGPGEFFTVDTCGAPLHSTMEVAQAGPGQPAHITVDFDDIFCSFSSGASQAGVYSVEMSPFNPTHEFGPLTRWKITSLGGDIYAGVVEVVPLSPPGPTCGSPDFDGDGDSGTDLDIEAFFRVLGGGSC